MGPGVQTHSNRSIYTPRVGIDCPARQGTALATREVLGAVSLCKAGFMDWLLHGLLAAPVHLQRALHGLPPASPFTRRALKRGSRSVTASQPVPGGVPTDPAWTVNGLLRRLTSRRAAKRAVPDILVCRPVMGMASMAGWAPGLSRRESG